MNRSAIDKGGRLKFLDRTVEFPVTPLKLPFFDGFSVVSVPNVVSVYLDILLIIWGI
jgi:hypothetical protein